MRPATLDGTRQGTGIPSADNAIATASSTAVITLIAPRRSEKERSRTRPIPSKATAAHGFPGAAATPDSSTLHDMNENLLDPFRHNAWATKELLRICRGLDEQQLQATVPGTYGTILPTLHHIVASEDYYRMLLTGEPRKWRSGDEPSSLEELERRADEMAAFWEELLAQPFDPERIVTEEDEEGRYEIRAGMVIAQVLNHGTDHRTQVLTILTTLGVEHTDLDGWDYGEATGRVVTTPPS